MSERREGPLVTIEGSCVNCRHVHSERYAVQSDSGHDVYCTVDGGKRSVGDTTWRTPDWCPLLGPAIACAVAARAPADRATANRQEG